MDLDAIVSTSLAVAATRSRLEKRERLATLLRALAPDEVRVAVHYLAGELPQGRVGVGAALLGEVDPRPIPTHPRLAILDVDRRIEAIGAIAGAGAKRRREEALSSLLAHATAGERRLLRGLLIGDLRQGALGGTLLEAVADATSLPAADVRRAAMLAGSIPDVATAVLLEGRDGLARFALTLFRPVLPMLATPAGDVDEALERLGPAILEVKLDGARVQVHKSADEVRVFTRRLHEVTDRVPEIVEAVRALPARELILDGEAIVLDRHGSPAPFQTTMRRFGRRQDVSEMRRTLPLAQVYFDVLLRDGASLIDQPARDRLAVLDETLAADQHVPRAIADDVDAALAFYDEALAAGHEGLMAKDPSALYEAGSRGAAWLKLKPSHTLDLVVLAVEEGSGRRRGWLSNLHLGARDPRDGGFVMLGKTFKGMTDTMLAWQTEHLKALAIGQEGHVLHVRPELVVEVAFSDVQASPQYPGGVALRFARLKAHRPDKSARDAATIDEVREIHRRGHREERPAPPPR